MTDNAKLSTMILGYHATDYADMWRLFVYENGEEPPDIMTLLKFWESIPSRTPKDQLAVAAKLVEAYNKVTTEGVFGMIQRFLNRVNAI